MSQKKDNIHGILIHTIHLLPHHGHPPIHQNGHLLPITHGLKLPINLPNGQPQLGLLLMNQNKDNIHGILIHGQAPHTNLQAPGINQLQPLNQTGHLLLSKLIQLHLGKDVHKKTVMMEQVFHLLIHLGHGHHQYLTTQI